MLLEPNSSASDPNTQNSSQENNQNKVLPCCTVPFSLNVAIYIQSAFERKWGIWEASQESWKCLPATKKTTEMWASLATMVSSKNSSAPSSSILLSDSVTPSLLCLSWIYSQNCWWLFFFRQIATINVSLRFIFREMGVCFHSWETFGSFVKKIVLDSKIYNYHCLYSHTCMWQTNMHLCRLTLAWMPPPGQSGASGLPPPPWCSKQSCLEPKTSDPALPWSPPGKHRNLKGCCRGEVIHLFREVRGKQGSTADEQQKYNPSHNDWLPSQLLSSLQDWFWLIFNLKSRWKVQLSSADTASPKPGACLQT